MNSKESPEIFSIYNVCKRKIMQDSTTKPCHKICIWKKNTSITPKWQGAELPNYSEKIIRNKNHIASHNYGLCYCSGVPAFRGLGRYYFLLYLFNNCLSFNLILYFINFYISFLLELPYLYYFKSPRFT